MPHVFQFLVMLCYEKHHSKPIIDMPRIIHRCDGIMASGLQPDTHGNVYCFPDTVVYVVLPDTHGNIFCFTCYNIYILFCLIW